MEIRTCSLCSIGQPRSSFSKSQWSKGDKAKCAACVTTGAKNKGRQRDRSGGGDGGDSGADASALGASKGQGETKSNGGAAGAGAGAAGERFQPFKPGHGEQKVASVASIVSLNARPQLDVPGFEGLLTCCADWPQTKKGEPPNAQSAIFLPLIACATGPFEGHCSSEELALAARWWEAALPAWGSWVRDLRTAIVDNLGAGGDLQSERTRLLARVKGKPTPLIHKSKGVGCVPHFRGRDQSEILELAPMVAVEVYACVTYMYSVKAVMKQQEQQQQQQQQQQRNGAITPTPLAGSGGGAGAGSTSSCGVGEAASVDNDGEITAEAATKLPTAAALMPAATTSSTQALATNSTAAALATSNTRTSSTSIGIWVVPEAAEVSTGSSDLSA